MRAARALNSHGRVGRPRPHSIAGGRRRPDLLGQRRRRTASPTRTSPGAEAPRSRSPGSTSTHPEGLAIDSAAGRIYWANRDGTEYSIRFANLDGSGGGILNTAPAPVVEPHGLAIYPAAGRIYWANLADHTIYFANLDGSGGGELDVTGALVEQPLGVAVYPAQNRVYWANFDGGEHDVDFANLDGTGGGGSARPDRGKRGHAEVGRHRRLDQPRLLGELQRPGAQLRQRERRRRR